MLSSKSVLAVLGLVAAGVNAHTAFTGLYINGQGVGDGTGIRMSNNADRATFPLSINQEELACNVSGDEGRDVVIPVNDGDTLSFEFRSSPPNRNGGDGAIAREHWGPCAVYAKKVDDASKAKASGGGWFKLLEYGHDAETNTWCNDLVKDKGGIITLDLPKGLQGGDYLLRPELLALHNAANGDPQFYTGCAQVRLKSNGNLVPESTVSIPGYIKPDEPGVTINIWEKPMAPYQIPGPKLAKLVPGSANEVEATSLFKKECMLVNANFCATEVPEFNNVQECWNAAQNCWNKNDECYRTSPPTGGANCKILESRCNRINDICHSGDFSSYERGKKLTPAPLKVEPVYFGETVKGASAGSPSKAPAEASTTSKRSAPSSTKTAPSVTSKSADATSTSSSSQSAPEQTQSPGEKAVDNNGPVAGNGKTKTVVLTQTVVVTSYQTVTARPFRA